MKVGVILSIARALFSSDFRLFFLYVVFAGLATIVDIGLLYFLTEKVGLWYIYSAAFSYSAGMVTNYSLNKYLNFRNRSRRIVPQFGLFATVAVVGLGLNQALLYAMVTYLDMWYMHAKLVSVMLVTIWSFYGHKELTFKIFT